ncbi:MAG: metallophosphoesterase family protein [Desulfomonilia bacterium]|jgi:hypothetical protein
MIMKRIGVLSDTHLKGPDAFLEEIVSNHFADVDLIVHAGDMVSLNVLDVFARMDKEVVAVCGNMDGYDVRGSFPASHTLVIEGLSIGIIHGWGSPVGIRRRIMNSFKKVDAVIYGHTHEGFSDTEAGIFFFNPGSPTDSRFTSRRSIGIITIHKHTIGGELIPL